jgi:TRAP-type C4-dicarboxylate transport system substrate-binding protein
MKRIIPILIVAILTVSLVLAGCAAPAPVAKPIKLVYESWLPAAHTGFETTKKFFKGLEDATGGLVTAEYNMAGVMGKPGDAYTRLVSGVTSVSQFGPAYMPGVFPMYSMFYNPIRSPSIEVFVKAMTGMQQKGYFDKDFADVKILGLFGAGPFILFTTNKKISSVKDIEGMKVRAANDAFVEVCQLLKSAPVTMPSGEVYLNLQKGVVDGAWWVTDAIVTDKVFEVTKYLWNAQMGVFPHVIAMSKTVWNSLPQSGRDYLDKGWINYSIAWAQENDVKRPSSMKVFSDAPGHEIVDLSDAEWGNLSSALSPIWNKWISGNEAKGLPGKKAVADLSQILTDNKVQKGLVGYTP